MNQPASTQRNALAQGGRDEHAGSVNFVNARDQIPTRVLFLFHRDEGLWIRAFDTHEHAKGLRARGMG